MNERPTVRHGTGNDDTIRLQHLGKRLLAGFYAALRALTLYPVENTTVQNALDELHRSARAITDLGQPMDLRLVEEFIFLNDSRLRLDIATFGAFSHVTNTLARHRIGAIEVDPAIDRSEWPHLLLLLLRPGGEDGPFEAFQKALAATPSVSNIRVQPDRSQNRTPTDLGEDAGAKESARRTYFQSVHVAREVLTDMRLGRAVNARRVKYAIQSIVDQVLVNESSILGMTALRDFDEYLFTHSVNVCIFSVVLGQKLGLSRVQLYELGLGALFHDIGKTRIDEAVVNKAGTLTEAEWEQVRRHPTDGLLALFSLHGFGEVPYRAMLMAYEHHMRESELSYPENKRPREPGLFSRIIAVTDGFDAATSTRSYQSLPLPPDEVLREMRDNPRRGYDPLLVKAFINVTGVYPPGTLTVLDTLELAVVTARNPDPSRIHEPLVKIVADPQGGWIDPPVTVDLASVDAATDKPKKRIIKTVDPAKYGVDVGAFFI